MIVQHHLVFGKKYAKEETAIWGSNTTAIRMYISTREDNIVVDWQDGNTTNFTTNKNEDFTITQPTTTSGSVFKSYSSAQIRNIQLKVAKGLKDVYSIFLTDGGTPGVNGIYFHDWSFFINQFNNLYSLFFHCPNAIQDIIGDLSQIPDSLERIQINNLQLQNNNDFYLNVSNFSQNSKLKYFNAITLGYMSLKNIYGDLSKLPPQMQYFSLAQNNANTFTYTAGRNWSSSFDTLNLGNAKLSVTDTDNLLIDLNNSITTAIGSKVINLANCFASNASNSAVAGLRAKGFTVTYSGGAQQFTFDLGQNVTINGTVTRAEGHDGRLNAIQFGSGNLVSADPLPASPVWSVAFWAKITSNNRGVIAEIGTNPDSAPTISLEANKGGTNINVMDRGTGYLELRVPQTHGNWVHYVAIIERGVSIRLHTNKVLTNTLADTYTGNFKSDKLYIGGRTSAYTFPLTGVLSPIKMFNYPLSQTEIDNLYNE